MPKPQNITDSYEFDLVGAGNLPFKGYVSSVDPTDCEPNICVQGSKNMYKKISGTMANRPGRLLRGVIDSTLAPTLASWEWNTSLGTVIPLRVNNGNLQFESDIADGSTLEWITLVSGITLPRYVFDSWWDATAQRDILVAVHGTSDITSWTGGVALFASATAPVAGTVSAVTITGGNAGTLYNVGDKLTIVGGDANCVLVVTSTGASGSVTGVKLEVAGTGYSTGTGNATTVNQGAGTGCEIDITTIVTAGTITKSDATKTWAQAGFSSSGNVVINGHTYSYDFGTDGQILQGVSGDASIEAVGSVVLQPVTVTGTDSNGAGTGLPAGGFTNDFLKVIGNRVHIGSYTSREIWISSSSNYLNYTVPSPRTSGSPELLTLDNTGKGISASKGNAYISAGSKDWYAISYTPLTVNVTVTEQTLVTKLPTADLSAALAHEFIDTVGDDIVYLSQDQQVRVLGIFRNISTQKIPSISQEVFSELAAETFMSGFNVGHLKAVGDFIYLTAPLAGRVYIRQTRETVNEQGNIVAERLWHPPFENGATRIAVISGVVFFHSNANPQIYQMWDTNQWHDDAPGGALSYTSVLQLPYRSNGRRQGMWKFNKIYYEGYMSEGTTLLGKTLIEFGGAKTTQTVNINTGSSPATFFTGSNPASLGDDSLGDNPLGDGLDTLGLGQQDLPKFRKICTVNPSNFFEAALVVYSQNQDDRWEMLCLGANQTINNEQQAGFISSGK